MHKSRARQRNRRRHFSPIWGLGGIIFLIGPQPLPLELKAMALYTLWSAAAASIGMTAK
jgi:hypothetical protein